MPTTDDLSGLMGPPDLPGAAQPLQYRQGIIRSWNPLDATNTVEVGGALLENLPILNTSEALLLGSGSVVGLISAGPSWAILGRLTVPNTPDATSALQLLSGRIYSATGAGPTTASTSFALGQPTVPNILVSNSGRMLVISSTLIDSATFVNAGNGGLMSFDITGATTLPGGDGQGPRFFSSDNTGSQSFHTRISVAYLATGLNPGLHTVQAKYRALAGVANITFGDPNITVLAL